MQPNITPYISNSYLPLKAEAFCVELLSKGISFEQIETSFTGGFRRSYRTDIEKAEFEYNDDLRQSIISIKLNRDGIYDRLPGGVFHQSRGNNKTLTINEMVAEYRRFRDEEKQARKFFKPIEQEIFRSGVLAQKEEQDLAFEMLSGNLKHELNRFWELPDGLPSEPIKVLLSIMPWIRGIKGDRQTTAKVLELMLKKPVSSVEYVTNHQKTDRAFTALGAGVLGADTVVGHCFEEPSHCWEFTIGELTKKEVTMYTPNLSFGKLLKHFEEIFIPLTIEVSFEFDIVDDTEEAFEPVLGYSLTI